MKQKHSPIWTFLALLVLAIFLIFVVYPLVLIMYKSVVNPADNSFTLANFTRFFTRKYYTNTLLNSFKVTVVSTLISATLGLVIAYITRQYRIAGSKALNICIVVSYLSPPFIGAYAWIQLLGRNGLFTKWINAIFGTSFGGIYGFAGIVLVFSLQSFPLVYMYVCGALQNLDNSLNEAAESLGANNFQRVTGIILPLVLPTWPALQQVSMNQLCCSRCIVPPSSLTWPRTSEMNSTLAGKLPFIRYNRPAKQKTLCTEAAF